VLWWKRDATCRLFYHAHCVAICEYEWRLDRRRVEPPSGASRSAVGVWHRNWIRFSWSRRCGAPADLQQYFGRR
jgi:hypothetical protein